MNGAVTVALQQEHDLIVLRRRLRAVGDDLHVDPRDVTRLSAASYEAAHLLLAAGHPATADIRLTQDRARPALRVTVLVRVDDQDCRRDLLCSLETAARQLEALVDRVVVEPADDGVSITLIAFASDGSSMRADAAELRDTNRDVVALYAELVEQTERARRAEDRLRLLEDDLRHRADDLAAANRAKEDFLATLSHELRTPLNAMLGWTRLLRTGRLDAKAMERALETVERNARLQEQLIADILDVSRIVTGKLRLNLRPIELVPVLDAAVDSMRATAQVKGVFLVQQIEPAGTVLGDPDRLQQVFWNLLSNAVKFTPRGGTVTVSSGRVGGNATIKVTDTGEGMPPELLPFVFDRFRQGDASATRPHGGLGLGLALVRHIIELHGGQVQAWSEGPGRGSSFALNLPVRAVQNADVQRPDIGSPLAGLRILVVDDEADAREIVSTALAHCGARTLAVGSTREALEHIQEFRPDVVVSDIAMPGEDGYSLVRKIRGMTSETAMVPIVALTGFTQPEDRRRAMRAGFKHFVPKPVEIDELASVVRTVVERR